MSTAVESLDLNPYPDPSREVDQMLDSFSAVQLNADRKRFTQLQRLSAVIGNHARRTVEVSEDVQPINFGDVMPSFVSPRQDRYRHVTFTEANSPVLTQEAWRIHTEGYASSGFVNDKAFDAATGYLYEDIDKSRGPFVEYHIAYNPDKADDRATMRIDGLAPGGTYKDLPAYQLCKDSLSQEGIALLEGITDQDRRVKEIAAMAKTAQGHPMGIHEIIRKVIQDEQGKDEVWMFSIVSSTFDSLAKSFGEDNFKVIGEEVAIPDSRVNPEIRLIPTIVYPDKFIDNILADYEKLNLIEAEDTQNAKRRDQLRLMRSLVFITEGLQENQMSPAVTEMRRTILSKAFVKA